MTDEEKNASEAFLDAYRKIERGGRLQITRDHGRFGVSIQHGQMTAQGGASGITWTENTRADVK